MNLNEVHVTTGLLLRSALLFAAVAGVLLVVTARRVPAARFRRLGNPIVVATGVVWFGIWSAMALLFWESVYSHVFPGWSRWLLPPMMGVGFGAAGWGLWHLGCRARGRPVVAFVLLGGLLGPVTHGWAVIRGIVTKPPLLQGASPLAAILVSWPEFTIYFIIITWLAVLGRRVAGSGRRPLA